MVSFRSTESPFIKALTEKLEMYHEKEDFLTTLTRVSRQVAYTYTSNKPNNSNLDQKKQMPWIASKLTKLIYFR